MADNKAATASLFAYRLMEELRDYAVEHGVPAMREFYQAKYGPTPPDRESAADLAARLGDVIRAEAARHGR